MANRNSNRRIAFADDFMTNRQFDSLHLSDFGGTFVSPESGNRGDKGVMASLAYLPEVADEEARLVANDRLRRFVCVEDLEERELSEWDLVEDEDGDFSFRKVDPRVGPKYIALEGTVEEALIKLLRTSPKYAVEAYKKAEALGRYDILINLPSIVANLVHEGVYSMQAFQQTLNGNGFSCYRTLKGFAAAERSFSGDGIACQMLQVLTVGQAA